MTVSNKARESLSNPDMALEVMKALYELHGEATIRLYNHIAQQGGEERSPYGTFLPASEIPRGNSVVPIWFGLYPARVTFLVGVTGAGKSTILYWMVLYAALNQALWGIEYGLQRPGTILYMDPENQGNWDRGDGGNCIEKLQRILGEDGVIPNTLMFHPATGCNLFDPNWQDWLIAEIVKNKADVLVLDPLANLFAVRDENSNAEAVEQFNILSKISDQTGVCVVGCHHTGKMEDVFGRGASARLSHADVGIIVAAKENEEENDDYSGSTKQREDVVRFKIVKDRPARFGKAALYLQMTGLDHFDRVDFDAWKSAKSKTSRSERCAREIEIALFDGIWHSQAELMGEMQSEGYGRNTYTEAVNYLVSQSRIEKSKNGSSVFLKSTASNYPDED